ncbi:MAG: glycosyltransferase [Patescibacteria group bacterium]
MKSSKKRFLFIPETYPSGLSGTSVKTRSTIELLLSEGCYVDVACIDFGVLKKRNLSHERLRIFSVYRQGTRKLRIALIVKLVSLIFSFKPVLVNRIFDRRLDQLIEILISSQNYDTIFFDGYSMLQYSRRFAKNQIYIDNEDITDLLWKRTKSELNIFKKIFFLTEYWRSKVFEKKYFRHVSSIWAICPNSQKRFKQLSPAKVVLMPTLIDRAENCFSAKSKDLVFIGTLSWPENINGVKWFLDSCWVKIQKDHPKTRLLIVGNLASESFRNFCSKYKNVRLTGYVKNLSSIYKKAALAISPILINSGIKIKVLNYLSFGIPTVAIEQSTWGMDSTYGVELAKENDFAEKVIAMLHNLPRRKELSSAAIKNISLYHSRKRLRKFFKDNEII